MYTKLHLCICIGTLSSQTVRYSTAARGGSPIWADVVAEFFPPVPYFSPRLRGPCDPAPQDLRILGSALWSWSLGPFAAHMPRVFLVNLPITKTLEFAEPSNLWFFSLVRLLPRSSPTDSRRGSSITPCTE